VIFINFKNDRGGTKKLRGAHGGIEMKTEKRIFPTRRKNKQKKKIQFKRGLPTRA